MGAPLGNKNGSRGTRWRDAIQRAIDCYPEPCTTGQNDTMRGINMAAHAFVRKMMESNDLGFFKEFGDRTDGKAAQSIELTGREGEPITIVKRKVIREGDQEPEKSQ